MQKVKVKVESQRYRIDSYTALFTVQGKILVNDEGKVEGVLKVKVKAHDLQVKGSSTWSETGPRKALD